MAETKKTSGAVTATVRPEPMSDGSLAYDVSAIIDGVSVLFACQDKAHAEALALALNGAAWADAECPPPVAACVIGGAP